MDQPTLLVPVPPVRAHGRIYDSVQDVVGGTPLVRVPRLSAAEGLVADLALKLGILQSARLGEGPDRAGHWSPRRRRRG